MTSLAFILGVRAARVLQRARAPARATSVGTGVMGGMLAATFLAIFFVPFFFKLIMERKLGEPRSSEELKQRGRAPSRAAPQPARTLRTPLAPRRRTEGSDD